MNTDDLKLCIIALEHLHDEIAGSPCVSGGEADRAQLVARIDGALIGVRQTAGEWEKEDYLESLYKQQKNTIKGNREKKKQED